MSRIAFVYVLIGAVLIAAAGLAYYGYSFSMRIADEVRQAHVATRTELASEKILNIQYAIEGAEQDIFDAVDFENWDALKKQLKRSLHSTVFVFDDELQIVPGATQQRRSNANWETFLKLFNEQIKPDLKLTDTKIDERRHHHARYQGRPYLFSYTKLWVDGKKVYVVAEVNVDYLVSKVIPVFLDVRGPNLYQLLNEEGYLVFGYPLQGGIPLDEIVELGFPNTLSLYKLRVAPRQGRILASKDNKRQKIDLAIIALAMCVVIAGLAFTIFAIRRENRLSRLKSDFISNVSHELKTPLSLISMFGEMLSMGRTRSEEQAAEYASIIHRESVRLSRLIDNVLDFAKIERGKDMYEFAPNVDLGDVVERALEISKHRIDRAKMSLHKDFQDGLNPVCVDENAMTLVILNLVDNAIKYAAAGEKLDVTVGQDKSEAFIIVRDYGPGIAKDEQGMVFDRFYRSKRVRLKPIRGSGIGLALVKRIPLAHKGRVEVIEETTPGCAIRLSIPFEQS